MRLACLFDIHANLPALEAVLAEVDRAGVDRIVIGGDVVPGPMPRECLERLRSLTVPTDYILGNGDRATRQARLGDMDPHVPPLFHAAMRWNGAQLTDADEAAIASWPLTVRHHVAGIGDVVFCHATPRDDNECFVKTTDDRVLRPIFDPLAAQLVVCGHTHMQFDRMVGATRVVNAGSVGMPFQEAGAYWALIDAGIELRRTPYDLAAAAEQVRKTSYPQADYAAAGIMAPPDEQTILEQFQKAEVK
jgi:putative phosphoesterase